METEKILFSLLKRQSRELAETAMRVLSEFTRNRNNRYETESDDTDRSFRDDEGRRYVFAGLKYLDNSGMDIHHRGLYVMGYRYDEDSLEIDRSELCEVHWHKLSDSTMTLPIILGYVTEAEFE